LFNLSLLVVEVVAMLLHIPEHLGVRCIIFIYRFRNVKNVKTHTSDGVDVYNKQRCGGYHTPSSANAAETSIATVWLESLKLFF
jgi:hypothetical protein